MSRRPARVGSVSTTASCEKTAPGTGDELRNWEFLPILKSSTLKRAALSAHLQGEDASKMLDFIDTWSDTDRWIGDLKVALEIGYNPQDIIANLGLPQDADPEHLLVDLEGRLKEHTRNFMQNLLEPDAACTEEH